MITFSSKGDFKRFDNFLERALETIKIGELNKYGRRGVEALREATPKDTGKTANSWYYVIERKNGVVSLSFHNSNIVDGFNIAMLIQYGHGTRNGYYVRGVDYINPALQPIFEQIAEDAWKEVKQNYYG